MEIKGLPRTTASHFFRRKRVKKSNNNNNNLVGACLLACEPPLLCTLFLKGYFCFNLLVSNFWFLTLRALSSRRSFYSIPFRPIPLLRGPEQPNAGWGEREPRCTRVGKTLALPAYPTRCNMIRVCAAVRTHICCMYEYTHFAFFFRAASFARRRGGPSDRFDWSS